MRKTKLDQRILRRLVEKTEGKMNEHSVRNALSRIRRKYPSLTLNASAEVFAKKRNFTIARWLNDKDRETLKTLVIEKVKIPSTKARRTKKIVVVARYGTDDKLLKSHLDEINKTYTHGCYTASFILCRKVLENLLVHHILKKKYPLHTEEHRKKYHDFGRNRNLDFDRILTNLRSSAKDFVSEKSLVERICQLADGFKETANEMTHSLYHIATQKEMDSKNFQHILDLIGRLEKSLA
jgi:hypothetical protein